MTRLVEIAPRYIVARINRRNVHLFDTTIPEPGTRGNLSDRSQIVCDLWTSGGYDMDELGTLAEDAGDFGRVAAMWPVCPRCERIAWRDFMADVRA